MSWATPPSKSSGDTLTAAEVNIISDDLLETGVAKVTTKGDLTPATGLNALTRIGVGANGTSLRADSDNAGGMKWQTPFTVSLQRSANKSISHDTNTEIDFTATNGPGGATSELYDYSGLHDTASNQTRITVTRKGLYLFGGYVAFAASAAGGRRNVAVAVNGTSVSINGQTALPTALGVDLSVTTMLQLAANDYVELRVYQDSGGALNVTVARLWLTYLHEVGL